MRKDILLVEDNPDDVELTRIAFEESNLANRLVVVGDGAEALDYLFARGASRRQLPDWLSTSQYSPTCLTAQTKRSKSTGFWM